MREAGPTSGDFTVTRGPEVPGTDALTVFYKLSGDADPSDYTVAIVPPAAGTFDPDTSTGTLTLPAGATSAFLRLTPVEDFSFEGAENVILSFNPGAGYQFGEASVASQNIVDKDAPDFYTEAFSSQAATLRPFDLNGRRLTFTPTSDTTYAGAVDPATSFPVNPAGGTVLVTGGAATVPLTSGSLNGGSWTISGLSVSPTIFGKSFSQIYINTAGNVTFESADISPDNSPSLHFAVGQRRISLLGTSLNLASGGTVSYRVVSSPPRVVVTFENARSNSTLPTVVNAQAEIGQDGKITITHLGTTVGDGIVGVANGQGISFPFYATDLSAYGPSLSGFNGWLAGHFNPAELNDPNVSAPAADPEGDGFSYLLEYALGSDPRVAGRPPGAPVASRSENFLKLTFQRNPALTDLTYVVEATGDLAGSWTEIARSVAGGATAASPGQSPSSIEETPAAAGALSVTVGDVNPVGPPTSQRFMRLRVQQQQQ